VDVKLAVVVAVVGVVASVDVVARAVDCCCLLLLYMAGAVGMKCSVEEEYDSGGEPSINENLFSKVKTTYKIQVFF
jgi:hypothetical protein